MSFLLKIPFSFWKVKQYGLFSTRDKKEKREKEAACLIPSPSLHSCECFLSTHVYCRKCRRSQKEIHPCRNLRRLCFMALKRSSPVNGKCLLLRVLMSQASREAGTLGARSDFWEPMACCYCKTCSKDHPSIEQRYVNE